MIERIKWLDDLKGFAIFLIVLGHVAVTVENISTGSVQSISNALFKGIYSFHVPLFFMIAGLTFSARSSFLEFFVKKFKRLMIPYYVWGGISAILVIVLSHFVLPLINSAATTTHFAEKSDVGAWWIPLVSILHAGAWPNGKGFFFNGVLWFLPVLFCTELFYYWVARYLKKTGDLFLSLGALLMVLLIASPLINKCVPFNLPCLIRYLPFVAIGHILGGVLLQHQRIEMSIKFSCGMLLLVIFGCSYFFDIARASSPFWVAWLTRATVLSIIVVELARHGVFRYFSMLAPYTIAIMLFHKYPLVVLQIATAKYLQIVLNNGIGSVLLCIAITAISIVLSIAAGKVIIRFMPWSLGTSRQKA